MPCFIVKKEKGRGWKSIFSLKMQIFTKKNAENFVDSWKSITFASWRSHVRVVSPQLFEKSDGNQTFFIENTPELGEQFIRNNPLKIRLFCWKQPDYFPMFKNRNATCVIFLEEFLLISVFYIFATRIKNDCIFIRYSLF